VKVQVILDSGGFDEEFLPDQLHERHDAISLQLKIKNSLFTIQMHTVLGEVIQRTP
jgi:hypothetical protein